MLISYLGYLKPSKKIKWEVFDIDYKGLYHVEG